MKKLLVLGGTGFLGTHFSRAASKEYDVYSLSKTTLPKDKEIPNVNYLYCDLRDKKKLHESLDKDFSYVMNFGGYVDHSQFYQSGNEVIDTHFGGLMNVLSILDLSKIYSFVNIGTSEEYWGKDSPMRESFKGKPYSCYSFSKHISNELLCFLNEFEGLRSINIRLFLVYGPGQANNRFLPQVINSCLKNEKFNVSPGEQIRDFAYVDDIVEGLLLAMKSTNFYGQTFNLASGQPLKIKKLVETVVEILGKGKPIFGGLEYRQHELMSLYADVTKAHENLGWSTKISIKEGLEKTIDWYL